MTHALNLTLRIKQDPEALKKLQEIKATFATKIQPEIDKALRESKIVHFARVLVIEDKYLQVITEYDGDPKEYTKFFQRKLPNVFSALFSVAEGVPAFETVDEFKKLDDNVFFELSKKLDIPSLGESVGESKGYLFDAFDGRTVQQILTKL